MGDITNKKEVDFHKYCNLCKYGSTNEDENPCNECLAQGWNENSHKPISYIRSEEYTEEDEKHSH